MGATTYKSSHQWSDFDENRFPIPGRFDSLEKPQHLQSDMGVQSGICSPEQSSGNLDGDSVDSYFQDKYLSSEEDLSGPEDEDGDQGDYLSAYGDDDDNEANCITRENIAKELLKSCRLAVAVSIIAAGRPKIVEMRQPSRSQRASLDRSRHQRPRQVQQQQQQQQTSQVTTPVQIPSALPQTRNYSSMSSVNSPHRLSILSYFNSYSGSNSEQTETTKRSSLMSGFSRSNRSSTISTSLPSPDLSFSSSPPAPVLATGALDSVESSKLAMAASTTSPLINVTSSPNTTQNQAVVVPSVSATRNRLRNAFLSRLGSGSSGTLENRKYLWRTRGTSDASPTSIYSTSPSPSRSGGLGLWRPSTSHSQAQAAQQEHTPATDSSPTCDTPFRLRLPSYITEGHEDNVVADDEGGDADFTTQQCPAKRTLLEFDR